MKLKGIDGGPHKRGTFHGFGRVPEDRREKIDYIFTDGVCQNAYVVPDTPVEGQYYSDHFAVCAEISLL